MKTERKPYTAWLLHQLQPVPIEASGVARHFEMGFEIVHDFSLFSLSGHSFFLSLSVPQTGCRVGWGGGGEGSRRNY